MGRQTNAWTVGAAAVAGMAGIGGCPLNPGAALGLQDWGRDLLSIPAGVIIGELIDQAQGTNTPVNIEDLRASIRDEILAEIANNAAFSGATNQDPSGLVGPEGPAGPAGEPGSSGPAGPQGVQGVAGPEGPAGSQGPEGSAGTAAEQGPEGAQGATGPEGQAGPQGEAGAQGAAGPPGEAGPQGASGPQGPSGEPGPAGADGLFAVALGCVENDGAATRGYGFNASRVANENGVYAVALVGYTFPESFNPDDLVILVTPSAIVQQEVVTYFDPEVGYGFLVEFRDVWLNRVNTEFCFAVYDTAINPFGDDGDPQ